MVQSTRKQTFADRLHESILQAGWQMHGSQARLSRLTKVTPKAVSKWINGEAVPRKEHIIIMAEELGVSAAWLHYGDGVSGSGLSDSPDGESSENQGIPVISYVQAGDFIEAINNSQPGDADEWLSFVPQGAGPSTFALRVQGDSNNPRIRDGEIVIVDPGVDPSPGRFVIARNDDGKVTLKLLMYSEGEPYLKPGNPNWPEQIIKLQEDWRIVGTVIGKYEKL